MKREIQGKYVTIATVSEKAQAFVPAPLPPRPPIDWTPELRGRFDQALLALGRLDSVSTLLWVRWAPKPYAPSFDRRWASVASGIRSMK